MTKRSISSQTDDARGEAIQLSDPQPTEWWQTGWCWVILALLSVLPFIAADLVMMPDYFNHIGRYHVMNYGAQSHFLSEYYDFKWVLIGNLGVDLLMVPLGKLFGTEAGARIAVAIIPPLSIYGIYALSRAIHGQVQAGALLAVPLIWTMDLAFGFVNYCLSLGLAMLAAAWWIGVRERGNAPSIAIALLLGVMVWLSHLVGWAILCVIIGSYELVRHFEEGASPVRSCVHTIAAIWPWFAPVLLIFLTLAFGDQQAALADDPTSQWSVDYKLLWIGALFKNSYLTLDLTTLLLMITGSVYLGLRHLRGHRYTMMLAGVILCASFATLPTALMGSFYADQRLLAPAWMMMLIGLSRLPVREASIVASCGLALFAVRMTAVSYDWHNRSVSLSRDLALIDHIPVGSRIAVGAPRSVCSSWQLTGFDTAASLAIPRREAFVNTQWNYAGYFLMLPRWTNGIDPHAVDTFIEGPAGDCNGVPVNTFLNELPRQKFTYVWLFEASRKATVPWLREVASGPHSTLYRIVPSP